MALDRVYALRRLVNRLSSGDLGADGVWLGDGFRRYLDCARDGLSVGAALGFEPGAWWLIERRALRDEALREYARRFLSEKRTLWGRATGLAVALHRYEGSQWHRDRLVAGLPAELAGTPRSVLFEAFRAGADDARGMPTSAKQLAAILSFEE